MRSARVLGPICLLVVAATGSPARDDPQLRAAEGFSSNVTHWSSESEWFCDSPFALHCVSTNPVLFWTNFEEVGGLWRWPAVASG